jgi:hypothetical protein
MRVRAFRAYLVSRCSYLASRGHSRYEIPDTRHEKITPYGVTTNEAAEFEVATLD